MTIEGETRDRILDKVEYIEGVVEILSQKQDIERDEYLNDWVQQAVVERAFQTAIEACLDIAELLLKELREEGPLARRRTAGRLIYWREDDEQSGGPPGSLPPGRGRGGEGH